MISVVFDTNVLASAFVGLERPGSVPGDLIRRWGDAEFTLVVSEPILIELNRTFHDRYFVQKLGRIGTVEAIRSLRSNAVIQPITIHVHGIATQPKDDLILATAASANAPYLVTGDRPLQGLGRFAQTVILSPRQFLDVLESNT